ncbi:MAG: cytochrome P450 family protein [Candidatus Promineifilaceae bacterium]
MTARYDLFSAEFKADPFPTFAEMRVNAPIYAHKDRSGRSVWYVTRYRDVMRVMRDPRFVKDPTRAQPSAPSPRARKQPSLQQSINRNMLFSDPPDHTRLRALVNLAFTPRRVERMREQVQTAADQLLDKVAGTGQIELIADYALPLAIIIISDLLGIPQADRDQVATWSQSIISPGGRGLKARERKRQMRAFVDYLNTLFAARQTDPQDDLITDLVNAEAEGEKLTEMELSSMVALLLVTGHETTVNLIGNGALTLLTHPDQLALLLANPSLIDSAVEELLRFDGPVETSTTRWVAENLLFDGHAMQQGDVMRVVITSANRDSAEFATPDTLDITRKRNKHLQFGHGIHYCLGAPLARLEGRIGLWTLFERLPNLRLTTPADQLKWRPGVLFRGLDMLPLAFQ